MPKEKPEPRVLYFIGIKGVAVAGLAVMAKQLGYEVSGSDVAEVFITDTLLADHQITVYEDFDPQRLKQLKPDLVIVGAAFGLQNPEVKAAKNLRIEMLAQSEMLGRLVGRFEGVGVAGVHGKTTTTSMLAYILKEAGYSPSYAIGTSNIPGLEGNAHIGEGKYFIVEADEYKKSELNFQPKFLDLPLKHVIITSIELDHPDIFQTSEQVYAAFYQLSTKIPRDGTIVACTDWPLVRRLVSRRVDRPCLTYGFETHSAFQIVNVSEAEVAKFSIKTSEKVYGPFTISAPGKHNILNATAAIIMAMKLGVSEPVLVAALKKFVGPQRRFQFLGEVNGAKVFDDYAHHPTAITYLIEAVRKRFPTKKIVLVFQPHTYSRTGKLLKEFAHSLAAVDTLILLNIWASAREKTGYVTIKDLIDEVKKEKQEVEYRSTLEEAETYLKTTIGPEDVVLLVGAGDVYKIFDGLRASSNG